MPSLEAIRASNAQAPSILPPGLVAVFAGGTAGIGAASMKEFARCTRQPRVYFIGRSQEKADNLIAELRTINLGGEYIFLQKDLVLLKSVDEVCEEIAKREKVVNLLYMSQGGVKMGVVTSEGLDYIPALVIYGRTRMALNLLPLISRATHLRRVVFVGAAGLEGRVDSTDWQGKRISMWNLRPHFASVMSMAWMGLAGHPGAEGVSFIHTYPGWVLTDLVRGDEGLVFFILWCVTQMVKVFNLGMPHDECGVRQMYVSLSARYPGVAGVKGGEGVPAGEGMKPVQTIEGTEGSGVYATGIDGENASEKVTRVMKGHRADGTVDKYWAHMLGEFQRITGRESIAIPKQ